ncbi:hypothetical protein [Actinokineospora iranica]|nr:hypothetical protein [Actinokineospora iranica]
MLLTSKLVDWWTQARQRTFLAEHGQSGQPVDVEDYWTELALGTRIAKEVTSGRWVTVSCLLRAGALTTWRDAGDALAMPGDTALDSFRSWLRSQAELRRHTGTIGLTAEEVKELTVLAEAVAR